jgi:hypothetical protein
MAAPTAPIDSPQLQQWSFDKPALSIRPDRSGSDSSASSPSLCTPNDTLRVDVAAATARSSPVPVLAKGSIALQERYMSSEENLSPAGDDSDDDSASEDEYDYEEAIIEECISMAPLNKTNNTAVRLSYAFVGRPKVVEMMSPTTDRAPSPLELPVLQQRSASLASLPTFIKPQAPRPSQRMSLGVTPKCTRPISPLAAIEPRRPSTSYSPSSQKSSQSDLAETSSNASLQTAPTSRSASLASEPPVRPVLQRIQTTQSHFRHSHMPPAPSPMSSAPHSFLNTDPYENSANASIPQVKQSSSHRRLRSISMKLSLARIAITPSSKKNDSRNSMSSKGQQMPASPFTPSTPQTAPLEASSGFMSPMPNKLRRASTIMRPKSRGSDSSRGPSPDIAPPPMPTLNRASTMQPFRQSRMVARGANEREPTLVIPPCPEAEFNEMTIKKLRKRKSLMDLL